MTTVAYEGLQAIQAEGQDVHLVLEDGTPVRLRLGDEAPIHAVLLDWFVTRPRRAQSERPAGLPPDPQVSPARPAATTASDIASQIRELGELLHDGLLTQPEFDQKKTELLRRL